MKELHQSVLLPEVLEWLAPEDGGIYVDGNLGLGGHSAKILEACAPEGKLIAFDWDAEAMAIAQERLACFGDRVSFVRQNFAAVKDVLAELGIDKVNGLLLDLGLSSLQLDESGRGFTFKGSEPLDMRMDDRGAKTAADLLNTASQEELADIFFYYGEERQARPIAASIVEKRRKEPFVTTEQLVTVVEWAIPKRFHPRKINVATKVFQALRIAVNRELENLAQVLEDGPKVLAPGGRFCVISFHSLEDRLVKQAFQKNPALRVLTRKPIIAGAGELAANPRSRSAKLRVAEVVRAEQ
ncbi:MAG: 16S rRNA (cytosine(1402)-N(4))-methyltransferase RsmH [Desulfobulbaceae bacterium]|nr:16S rRNA (cytosine(1402)-N(4))-methyltransferase RsmH [Desulfobulbaceae bacterium]